MSICNESPFCLAASFLHPAVSFLQHGAYSHTLQFYIVRSRELDSMILMSPFQLDILCVILWFCCLTKVKVKFSVLFFAGFFPLLQIMGHNQLDSLHGENAFYFNEAVVCVSLRRINRSNSSLVYEDGVYGMNISNSDVGGTSENQGDLKMDSSCQPALTSALWKSTSPYQQMSFSCKSSKDSLNNYN